MFDLYVNVHAGDNKHHGWEIRKANKDKWFRFPFYLNASEQFPNQPNQVIRMRSITDIALIKLNNTFTPHLRDGDVYRINTICLPSILENNTQPENATFYGFGTIAGTSDWATNLKKGQVVLEPMEKCFLAHMFCANFSGDSPRPCKVLFEGISYVFLVFISFLLLKADSGGPLVQYIERNRAVLIGIMKGTVPDTVSSCSDQIQHARWVSVSLHISWILETIASN